MSDIKKSETDDCTQGPAIISCMTTSGGNSKKTIRFVEDSQSQQSDDISGFSSNQKQALTQITASRSISDCSRDDMDIDVDDIISDKQLRFKSIKSIDTLASQGEERIIENQSPSKRNEKSNTASSVQSENQDDNMSVHFGGEEVFEENQEEFPKFEYEPDDMPAKSILKNDLNRSRNQSFDVRNLKDIEGKIISHENLSAGEEEEDKSSRRSNNTILKDSVDDQGSQEDNDNYDDDYLEDDENNNNNSKDYRQRMDSEVRFKLVPQVEEQEVTVSDLIDPVPLVQGQKRNSLSFPAYSILKNSPLVQPSEFKALKNIDKVSHYGQEKSQASQEEDEKEEAEEDRKDGEESDVRFVGDVVLQEENAYKFRYNPEENPKKPIIKKIQGSTSLSSSTPTHAELRKKKRMSYDFSTLKNVDGKILKHLQQKFLEDDTQIGNQVEERDIKFGGIEILEQGKPGGETPQSSKSTQPQKPILKQHGRSSSCDFKKSIKNIDGVYLRKKESSSSEEDTKVVHFGDTIQSSSPNSEQNQPPQETQETSAQPSDPQGLDAKRSPHAQLEELPDSASEDKKSILKRPSSAHTRLPLSMLASCDESPDGNKKKSTFSNRKIEIKETIKLETPTEETFTANWTSIRNDYIESAIKFINRIDPKNLNKTFPSGMDSILFSQIVDVVHSAQDNDQVIKQWVHNLQKIKNFDLLIQSNKHLEEALQEIMDTLLSNQVICSQEHYRLCGRYGLNKE